MSEPGMITKIARFGNDSTGLEKILRLLQALCMIFASLLSPSEALPFKTGIKQLGLGRRYLRFFKVFPLLDGLVALMGRKDGSGILHMLEIGKLGFGALYLLGQNLTIAEAMGIHASPWAAPVMAEANKFWFYSLVCALSLTLHALITLPSPSVPTVPASKSFTERTKAGMEKRKAEERAAAIAEKRNKLMKEFVMYAADLLIPGELTGWIEVEGWVVGGAMVVSTVLAGEEVWARVNC